MKVIKLHTTYLQTRWTYLHIHRYIYIKEWYKAEHTAVPYPLFKNIVSSIIHFFLSPSSHFTSKIYTNVHEEALQVEVTSSETILEIKYHEILKGGSFFLFFFSFFFLFEMHQVDWKQQIPISSAVSSPQILKPFKLTHLSTNIHYFHTLFFFVLL